MEQGALPADKAPAYVDPQGRWYTANYLLTEAPPSFAAGALPFPRAESFGDSESFVVAVSEWTAQVQTQLGKVTLPVPISRVFCRPDAAGLGEGAFDDETAVELTTAEFESTVVEADSQRLRIASTPDKALPVSEWRGSFVAAPPSRRAGAEAMKRWCWVALNR